MCQHCKKPGMLRVCLCPSWGQSSPQHRQDQSARCVSPNSFSSFSSWPRPPLALCGDMAATSQPCLDITTQPRLQRCSLKPYVSNTGAPKSLPEAEQRSWSTQGKSLSKVQQKSSLAVFAVNTAHAPQSHPGHVLCPIPTWHWGTPHALWNSSMTVGHPSAPPPRPALCQWGIAQAPTTTQQRALINRI